ncbi:aldo/keto reductase [Streptomyces scopuliridis]|uniref:aldo/keto reductase n=1 Tax=Streptomyces scopuliridis TaxID=452529 RepID=UPI00368690F1
MRMRKLGRTGIEVSAYCLGTMVFSKMGNPDHDDCVRMIHRALDEGIDFVDTADVYGYSETEEIVGKALKGHRDEVVPATKFNGPMGEGPNRGGSSRRWVVQAVEGSLKRLRTDYIDLYQIHHPDPYTDIEGTLSALTDLVRAGKVRAIGSSNLPASEIVEVQWVSQRRGLHCLRTEQPTYHADTVNSSRTHGLSYRGVDPADPPPHPPSHNSSCAWPARTAPGATAGHRAKSLASDIRSPQPQPGRPCTPGGIDPTPQHSGPTPIPHRPGPRHHRRRLPRPR